MPKIIKSEEAKKEPAYEKPLFKKSDGLQFTKEIWLALNAGRYCMQCSGCHGCR